MAILFFLIHHLCGDFQELKKGLLVPLLEDLVLIIVIFFKIDVRWASYIDDSLDMLAINVVNVW